MLHTCWVTYVDVSCIVVVVAERTCSCSVCIGCSLHACVHALMRTCVCVTAQQGQHWLVVLAVLVAESKEASESYGKLRSSGYGAAALALVVWVGHGHQKASVAGMSCSARTIVQHVRMVNYPCW
jgi:hypothetical protein